MSARTHPRALRMLTLRMSSRRWRTLGCAQRWPAKYSLTSPCSMAVAFMAASAGDRPSTASGYATDSLMYAVGPDLHAVPAGVGGVPSAVLCQQPRAAADASLHACAPVGRDQWPRHGHRLHLRPPPPLAPAAIQAARRTAVGTCKRRWRLPSPALAHTPTWWAARRSRR